MEDKKPPLLSVISSGCKTPPGEVKFSNLIKPFYYPNSPKIPRYSITVIFNPKTDKEFLEGLQSIEKNEGVESIVKNDTFKKDGELVNSGKFLIKFQTKEILPAFKVMGTSKRDFKLEEEIPKNTKVIVLFEILRYTKMNPFKTEHGLSFKPTEIQIME